MITNTFKNEGFMKLIRYLTIFLSLCVSTVAWSEELPSPEEHNLANYHLLDETCAGACHENEESSDEGDFEFSSCKECHDTLGNLKGVSHSLKHWESESMECIDCHRPHEEFDPSETCSNCHEDDDDRLIEFRKLQSPYLDDYEERQKLYDSLNIIPK